MHTFKCTGGMDPGSSTPVVTLITRRRVAPSVLMPREFTKRCAYVDCNKTTDKRSFGRIRPLSPDQLSLFSSWLKTPNDGVVCDYHYTLLRRLLKRLQPTLISALRLFHSAD
jgi:hypothetical protein